MLTSVFEALMVQFPASLAGSRIIIKDAVSLCAGEHCTVLFPMSLDQEGFGTLPLQTILSGYLEECWKPYGSHSGTTGREGKYLREAAERREQCSELSKSFPPFPPLS